MQKCPNEPWNTWNSLLSQVFLAAEESAARRFGKMRFPTEYFLYLDNPGATCRGGVECPLAGTNIVMET